MKKNKLFGITTLVVIIGLLFTGCGDGGGGGSGTTGGGGTTGGNTNGSAKSITITGIPGGGLHAIGIYIYIPEEDIAYGDNEEFTGSSITIPLYDNDDQPWTGSGYYCIYLYLATDGVGDFEYFYTGGASINIDDDNWEEKLPKYNFSSANSIIPLTQFYGGTDFW